MPEKDHSTHVPCAAADRAAAAARNLGAPEHTRDDAALAAALEAAEPGLAAAIGARQPHLYSATAVYAARADVERMQAIIAAIETAVAHPAYRAATLAHAPATAARESAAHGVFMGYDFHLAPDGPKLIEINTNAGGALLQALLLRAQRPAPGWVHGPLAPEALAATFVAMLHEEWRTRGAARALASVAIVDDRPAEQYLYPEFRLCAALLRNHGLQAPIADAAELMLCHGRVWCEQTPLDLIYNRLTDFALAEPAHTAVREAWLRDLAVVSPHPRVHALYADKRNLVYLSDPGFLRDLGLDDASVALLADAVPRTVTVNAERADYFWDTRRQWFFKPAGGYGGRAAYRGDKLTRRVFGEILAGTYVAQALVPPPERLVEVDGAAVALKYDVRNFAYRGAVQLLAARLYRGQTTNFRTPGGGLAPVRYPA
jgi:hypothetical protein